MLRPRICILKSFPIRFRKIVVKSCLINNLRLCFTAPCQIWSWIIKFGSWTTDLFLHIICIYSIILHHRIVLDRDTCDLSQKCRKKEMTFNVTIQYNTIMKYNRIYAYKICKKRSVVQDMSERVDDWRPKTGRRKTTKSRGLFIKQAPLTTISRKHIRDDFRM